MRDTARRVARAVEAGEATLVLGGDCTVGIGTVAGHVGSEERVGLIYSDAHADLNLRDEISPGALDWMSMAHMLGEEGAARELAEVGPRSPLLAPEQVVLFAWDPEQATDHERAAIERLSVDVVPVDEVSADPSGAARRALELLEGRAERLIVHFDVDVIDFTDVPLSENPGRNEGLAYEHALEALAALADSRRIVGLTVTELNPRPRRGGRRERPATRTGPRPSLHTKLSLA